MEEQCAPVVHACEAEDEAKLREQLHCRIARFIARQAALAKRLPCLQLVHLPPPTRLLPAKRDIWSNGNVVADTAENQTSTLARRGASKASIQVSNLAR